ncbi:hypothetical protein LTR96_005527 [Exophiala xenobiotica]|nr:hypothetical protein LTR96_005527 [Exophiala xenobiotica]KAK5427646.1 hypothetical protein LTR34_009134 [Exophiala xenobiotica]
MSIPRRKMLTLPAPRIPHPPRAVSPSVTRGRTAWLTDILRKLAPVLRLCAIMFDSVGWIALILVFAGPMMLSGLYEAVLDWKILSALKNETGSRLPEDAVIELLATVVAGNLQHRTHEVQPQAEMKEALLNNANAEAQRTRLLGLVDSQMGYGAIVGAPVVFYLGAFVYTILDLSNEPSDQDAAISLAFGVEWMILVHVAIIGSCLLATNNPSTASVLNLAGHLQPGLWQRLLGGDLTILADIYNTRYQPVTMWSRGRNKRQWVNDSTAFLNHQSLSKPLKIGWRARMLIFLATCVLINLPPVAGAVVAWRTPPIGWGCRSLSFVCYAASELLITALFMLMHGIRPPDELVKPTGPGKTSAGALDWLRYHGHMSSCIAVYILYALSCIGCLFVVLGSTLMQVVGVYRNCFSYVNAPEWYHLGSATVQVATDTQEQRNSSHNWIVFGGTATAFMGVCCFVGWWYQMVIRERYKDVVKSRFGH